MISNELSNEPSNGSTHAGYPVLLHLENKQCLIIGGGRVATRKVQGLLAANATITLISPTLTATLHDYAQNKTLTYRQEYFEPGAISELHPFLVFAATNDPAVNQLIVEEARAIGVLVDAVDAGGARDFSSMASLRRGTITVGVHVGGASAALATHLKAQIAHVVGPEYEQFSRWLAQVRPQIHREVADDAIRQELWRTVLASSILEQLRGNDPIGAEKTLREVIARTLNKGEQ